VRLADIVAELDREFSIDLVRDDDWAPAFAQVYPDPYWREFVEPDYEGRWDGLMVRGAEEVPAAATCVFPGDSVVAQLEPGTLLFSEHPLDFGDAPGFLPFTRETFETMRERGISFFHAHAPIDQHPRYSPSRLVAQGVGMDALEEYFPIDENLPGGAAVIGQSMLTVDGLADSLRAFLGPDIPIHVLTRTQQLAGRVAIVAGGGADRDILTASLERGCQTYVTGNAATNCVLDFVQTQVREFRALADREHVTLIDATHYGMERPPQLELVRWFEERGVPCRFVENGPK
jgi:putative NIF3 family GTP cyclohydrolase 1 type 2